MTPAAAGPRSCCSLDLFLFHRTADVLTLKPAYVSLVFQAEIGNAIFIVPLKVHDYTGVPQGLQFSVKEQFGELPLHIDLRPETFLDRREDFPPAGVERPLQGVLNRHPRVEEYWRHPCLRVALVSLKIRSSMAILFRKSKGKTRKYGRMFIINV